MDMKAFQHGHPFIKIRHFLLRFEEAFTRELDPEVGKPADNDEKHWGLLVKMIRTIQEDVKSFFGPRGDEGFNKKELGRFFWDVEAYLKETVGVRNDIDALAKAAVSPRFRPLFGYTLKITPVSSLSAEAPTIPLTAEEWEDVLEKALSYDQKELRQLQNAFNYYQKDQKDIQKLLGDGCEPRVMNMTWISNDTAEMAKETLPEHMVVRCEVATLLHIERQGSHLPRAYSYIGVSKPPCGACHAFFQAYNLDHQTRFVTRGTDAKFYWPWQFPQNFARAKETALKTYQILCRHWVNSYQGYQLEKVPLQSDSAVAPWAYMTDEGRARMREFFDWDGDH
jgi:hypothetical protein